jgi:tryptophan-rich sensory protein
MYNAWMFSCLSFCWSHVLPLVQLGLCFNQVAGIRRLTNLSGLRRTGSFPWLGQRSIFQFPSPGARVADMEGNAIALAFWAMQAGFSTLWTPVFFGLRRLRGALLVMLPLWVSVLGATLAMFELDRAAGLAFLPYIIWVTIAAALNYRVAQLNPTVAPRDLSAD